MGVSTKRWWNYFQHFFISTNSEVYKSLSIVATTNNRFPTDRERASEFTISVTVINCVGVVFAKGATTCMYKEREWVIMVSKNKDRGDSFTSKLGTISVDRPSAPSPVTPFSGSGNKLQKHLMMSHSNK